MTDKFDALRKAVSRMPMPGPYRHDRRYEGKLSVERIYATGKRGERQTISEMWGGHERDHDTAELLAACDPDTIRALLAEADRYRQFFASGLPITYRGQDYRSKQELDAAIDADLAGGEGKT